MAWCPFSTGEDERSIAFAKFDGRMSDFPPALVAYRAAKVTGSCTPYIVQYKQLTEPQTATQRCTNQAVPISGMVGRGSGLERSALAQHTAKLKKITCRRNPAGLHTQAASPVRTAFSKVHALYLPCTEAGGDSTENSDTDA